MPKKISDIFQINPQILIDHNVFNGVINIDSPFYVDPRLLEKTTVPELQQSYKKFTNHFDDVLKSVLNFIEGRENFETITNKLIFSEIPVAGLGYSINHAGGKGIGSQLSNNLSKTVVELAKLGIIDPIIFELSGLFEKNIGADRISDMTIHILLSELAQFSSRVAESLKLPKAAKPTLIAGKYFYGLPCYSSQGILLVPQDILTALPLAYSWTSADVITTHNQELRGYINTKIKKSWKASPTWKDVALKKKDLRKHILEQPELMKNLIDKYKGKSAIAYNFKSDPDEVFRWHESAREYANKYPLNLKDFESESNEKIVEIICEHFSKLVKGGLCVEFYKKSGEPNNEKVGQLILLELLENYIQRSSFKLTFDLKNDTINLSNQNFFGEISIILKYTSTRNIVKEYEEMLGKNQSSFKLSNSTLILIMLNRGKSIIDEINALDRKHRQENIKFFKRVDIDGRIQGTGGNKRPLIR
ncbi:MULTISPECIES: hypothetical protein [Nostoc]|uniref:Uncharacterized protein n=1 Tax=Nostoc paludosum FACHB-159 TaxID=2692908 RepID=A0ABR8KL10_9NOSO|nr:MULTISPECIES: hypothetical protein [Nostoc]MBD2683085.1 hypothetical protein [Nostoc sp. FACHB-857]MBD2739428.1 hypothetical protein [Nostoc paludosum FACHB-159]